MKRCRLQMTLILNIDGFRMLNSGAQAWGLLTAGLRDIPESEEMNWRASL